MSDETTVNAGSEASGEQPTPEIETTQVEAPSETPQDAGGDADEGADKASEPKTGDPCTCPDGRPGTVHVLDEGLVCLPNQG